MTFLTFPVVLTLRIFLQFFQDGNFWKIFRNPRFSKLLIQDTLFFNSAQQDLCCEIFCEIFANFGKTKIFNLVRKFFKNYQKSFFCWFELAQFFCFYILPFFRYWQNGKWQFLEHLKNVFKTKNFQNFGLGLSARIFFSWFFTMSI